MGIKMLVFFAVASFTGWLLFFAGVGTRREVRRKKDAQYTQCVGTIVDYVRKEVPAGRSGTRVTWKPVVAFTADGRKLRAEYENSMDRDQFPVGAEVGVLYNVSNPAHFHLEADPVFIDSGAGAMRVGLIWILASALLTVLLAVFVGGATFDFGEMWYRVRSFFRHFILLSG